MLKQMKKVYILLLAVSMGSFAMAQTSKVSESDKKTEAKKEDVHAGHNHDAAPATASMVSPAIAPAVDMAKPIAEDNLTLAESAFNFGKIPQGKPVTHDFAIANSGKTELKLDNVQASCGCTTPVWKAGPYKAGEKAVITVGYNAASPGNFTKTVTITYNNGLSKVITISGEVWQAPATPAPENKSVQMLKNNGK